MTSFTPDQVQRLETLLRDCPGCPPFFVTEEGITFLTSLTGRGPIIVCTIDFLMALAQLLMTFQHETC